MARNALCTALHNKTRKKTSVIKLKKTHSKDLHKCGDKSILWSYQEKFNVIKMSILCHIDSMQYHQQP